MPVRSVIFRTFGASYSYNSWKSRDGHSFVTRSCLQRVRKLLRNKGSECDASRLLPMPNQFELCMKEKRFVYAIHKSRSKQCICLTVGG